MIINVEVKTITMQYGLIKEIVRYEDTLEETGTRVYVIHYVGKPTAPYIVPKTTG